MLTGLKAEVHPADSSYLSDTCLKRSGGGSSPTSPGTVRSLLAGGLAVSRLAQLLAHFGDWIKFRDSEESAVRCLSEPEQGASCEFLGLWSCFWSSSRSPVAVGVGSGCEVCRSAPFPLPSQLPTQDYTLFRVKFPPREVTQHNNLLQINVSN